MYKTLFSAAAAAGLAATPALAQSQPAIDLAFRMIDGNLEELCEAGTPSGGRSCVYQAGELEGDECWSEDGSTDENCSEDIIGYIIDYCVERASGDAVCSRMDYFFADGS